MNKQTHIYNFKKKIDPNNFSIIQYEDKVVKSYYSNSYNLQAEKNTYTCSFEESKTLDFNKPVILMCIKDNVELLKYTLNNMRDNKVFDVANVVVIDDRSSDATVKAIAIENDCSYLRVDNSQNIFNFSMLHNLAVHALRSHTKNLKEIILWSSDLWTDNPETLLSLYQNHIDDKNAITGTKLLYPTKEFLHFREGRENTVQYAGSMFGPRPNEAGLFALHMFRGNPMDDPKVNCDKGELFITAAFLIIDTDWYIETGGFCPSMKAGYQDVDLCLRANEQNKRVMYYGKDLHLYHYENYTLDDKKEELKKQYNSDKLWYKGFWEPARVKNLLYVHEK